MGGAGRPVMGTTELYHTLDDLLLDPSPHVP